MDSAFSTPLPVDKTESELDSSLTCGKAGLLPGDEQSGVATRKKATIGFKVAALTPTPCGEKTRTSCNCGSLDGLET
jgi:hypothetical protein